MITKLLLLFWFSCYLFVVVVLFFLSLFSSCDTISMKSVVTAKFMKYLVAPKDQLLVNICSVPIKRVSLAPVALANEGVVFS